jgi:hypothetical protein
MGGRGQVGTGTEMEFPIIVGPLGAILGDV